MYIKKWQFKDVDEAVLYMTADYRKKGTHFFKLLGISNITFDRRLNKRELEITGMPSCIMHYVRESLKFLPILGDR